MKTYYDLTSKEKGKYIAEFKKTPGGKSLFERRAFLIILALIFYFGIGLLSIYEEEANLVVSQFETIENFAGFMIILAIAYSTYFEINFTSWLKNKHDIKRW